MTSLENSLRNIPVPSRKDYKKLIVKTQDDINRVRWKAFHFLKGAEDRDDDGDDRGSNKETGGFKAGNTRHGSMKSKHLRTTFMA